MIGVLASRTLTSLAVYALVGSVGTLMLAVGLFDETAAAAALYYLVHSTLAGAALFLLADLVARRRGGAGDRLVAAPPFAQLDLLAGLFFLAAIAAVGLPPLSGFVGKILILEALGAGPHWAWLWAVVLVGSLFALIGFARAGSIVFWKCEADRGEQEPDRPSNDTAGICAVAALVAGPVLLALFAGPAMSAMDATAHQLFTPQRYIEAVLGSGVDVAKAAAMTRRFLPHPRLSLFVTLIWLALANEISAGCRRHGGGAGRPDADRSPARSGPIRPGSRRPLKVLEYCGVVAWDIVLANLQVARLILRVPNDQLRSRYVTVPLALTSPEAITVLAGTITMTPGTVSAELSADGRALLVHGLDVPDPDALVADIKSRYEARLLEIFP